MRRRNGTWKLSLVAGVAILAVSACGPGNFNTAENENVLIVAAQSEVPSLDPQSINGTVGLRITDAIYDTLVREELGSTTKEATAIEPFLAESWTVSEDGITYLLVIREGVTFQDGTLLDAAAVHKNFERLLNPDASFYSSTAAANMGFLTRWIKDTEVRSDQELAITLKKPFVELPRLLKDRRMGIISPTAIEQKTEQELAIHPVGTGPFSTTGVAPGESIRLDRFDAYWRGAPKLESMVFVTIQDPGAMATAMQTRQVDLILSAGAQQIAQLSNDEGITVQFPDAANEYFVRLNTKSGPTANRQVRQALNFAINRDAIETATDGQARPLYGALPIGNTLWQSDFESVYSYSADRARELLSSAGYGDGFSLKVYAPSAGPGFSQSKQIMALVQQDLAAVGVDLSVEYMDFTTLVSVEGPGYVDGIAGSYNGWTTGADNAYWLETMFSPALTPPAGANRGWYLNEQVGAMFTSARGMVNEDARRSLYLEVVEQIDEDAPWIFLYQDRLPRMYLTQVEGINENPSAFVDYAVISK